MGQVGAFEMLGTTRVELDWQCRVRVGSRGLFRALGKDLVVAKTFVDVRAWWLETRKRIITHLNPERRERKT